MDIASSVTIRGDFLTIFRYGAKVENWPAILPHYRDVEILDDAGEEPGGRADSEDARHGSKHTAHETRLVRMHCVRAFGPLRWPCKWTARQVVEEESGRILFFHTSGPAKGMEVEWSLCDTPDGVLTTIKHRKRSGNPIMGFYFDRIVGVMFVSPIASKTLATIKEIVERETQK